MISDIDWRSIPPTFDPAAVKILQRELGVPESLELHKRVMARLRERDIFLPSREELIHAYQEETQ
jgi:hypothetical protein